MGEAESWLLDLELFGMRLGLDRMHRLTTALGLPQRRFASIHVVGSNGKTSTARMIAAILRRHGLRTGLYTSPHLRSFVERIEVDEAPITDAEMQRAVGDVRQAAAAVDRAADDPEDRVTQFEALTAAAFHALARRGVDVAVVEAGLGGRLDATNVIPSRVQVLTSVALEHTSWLGSTLAEIAAEKLAVVGDHGTLVTGELPPEADAVADRMAGERQARRVRTSATEVDGIPLGPPGSFQRSNLALARAAAEAFVGGGLENEAVKQAAVEVHIPGRLEVVARAPLVVHDAAHNPAGARALAEALPEVVGDRRPVVGVIGVLDDKDVAGVLGPLLAVCDRAILTGFAHPRALPPDTLEAEAAALGRPDVETAADVHDALDRARSLAGSEGAVLVAGSIRLLAGVRPGPAPARLSTL